MGKGPASGCLDPLRQEIERADDLPGPYREQKGLDSEPGLPKTIFQASRRLSQSVGYAAWYVLQLEHDLMYMS
jgi:hypothetical protein